MSDLVSRATDKEELPPTMRELLDELVVATQWAGNWEDDPSCPYVDHEDACGSLLDSRAEIESRFDALESENERLRRVVGLCKDCTMLIEEERMERRISSTSEETG